MSGQASQGTDYTLSGTPGQVTIPAGQSSATVTMHSMEESNERRERNETATMTLSKGARYKLSNNKATVTIIEDP
jgi:hypothetical protein